MIWLLIPLWFLIGGGIAYYILWQKRRPRGVRGVTASSQFEDDLLDLLFIDGPLTFADKMYLSLDTEPPEKEDEH